MKTVFLHASGSSMTLKTGLSPPCARTQYDPTIYKRTIALLSGKEGGAIRCAESSRVAHAHLITRLLLASFPDRLAWERG